MSLATCDWLGTNRLPEPASCQCCLVHNKGVERGSNNMLKIRVTKGITDDCHDAQVTNVKNFMGLYFHNYVGKVSTQRPRKRQDTPLLIST